MLVLMIQEDCFERYSRQLSINGWGREGQEKLRCATVLIGGVGGLGGPVAYYLSAAGVGKIKLVDSDRVELSNLNRQILHDENSLRQWKVDSARKRLNAFNGVIAIETFPVRIHDENIDEIARDCSLLVDCFDSFASRMVLNRFAVDHRVPLVHGGVAETRGQVCVVAPGGRPCLECLYADVEQDAGVPVLGALAGIVGSMEALEAIKLITGIGEPLMGRLVICNALSPDYRELPFLENPECPVCGERK